MSTLLALLAATALAAPSFPKTLMSLKVKDAEAAAVFRLIAEKANADLVIADCANAKPITLELRNVAIQDVITLIATQYALDVSYDGRTLQVDCD